MCARPTALAMDRENCCFERKEDQVAHKHRLCRSGLFFISVDGTDCKCNEPAHPDYPVDSKMKSEKFNKAGWKYEVAMLVHEPKIVWICGPHKASKHDMTTFREKLKGMLQELPGSMASVDLGYRTQEVDEEGLLSWPNSVDGLDAREHKSRIRCRMESLFGRMKNFRILKDTFRFTKHQHEIAFTAVAVTIQYQMDNGSPVYYI